MSYKREKIKIKIQSRHHYKENKRTTAAIWFSRTGHYDRATNILLPSLSCLLVIPWNNIASKVKLCHNLYLQIGFVAVILGFTHTIDFCVNVLQIFFRHSHIGNFLYKSFSICSQTLQLQILSENSEPFVLLTLYLFQLSTPNLAPLCKAIQVIFTYDKSDTTISVV